MIFFKVVFDEIVMWERKFYLFEIEVVYKWIVRIGCGFDLEKGNEEIFVFC